MDSKGSRLLFPALLVCFLLSGATALVYEVLWVRMLILRLGSTSLAISTVVTAFMAGLAFGAWAAGRYSSRITRPLAVYALLELAIAVSAVLLPLAFEVIHPLYRLIWKQFHPQFLAFSLLQFAFTFLLLFVPTAMMGATLPLLSQACVRHPHEVGERVGALYGINTLGAVLGTLGSGFFLLPALGVTKTIWATTTINAVLALAVWYLDRTYQRGETEVPEGQERAQERSRLGLGVAGELAANGRLGGPPHLRLHFDGLPGGLESHPESGDWIFRLRFYHRSGHLPIGYCSGQPGDVPLDQAFERLACLVDRSGTSVHCLRRLCLHKPGESFTLLLLTRLSLGRS